MLMGHDAQIANASTNVYQSGVLARLGERPVERDRHGQSRTSHCQFSHRLLPRKVDVSRPLSWRDGLFFYCRILRYSIINVTSRTGRAGSMQPLLVPVIPLVTYYYLRYKSLEDWLQARFQDNLLNV